MAAVSAKLQLRRDTRSRWNFFNPLLQAGEIGVELPTLPGEFPMFKLGDGTTHWNDLPYGGLRGVGVASITQVGLSAPESLDTYKITYTDGTEGLFQVQNGLNGNSIISITRTTGDGSAGSLDTYEIEYTKAAKTTFTVQNGANGRGITSILRTVGTGANGTSDTYTITYTDSTTTNFDVYNGKDGRAIINFQRTSGNGNPGTTDIYTFTYSDGTTNDIAVYNGQNGVSVTGLDKVSGTSQPGETDIYRLNYSNGTFTQFSIYNGKDGRAITSFVKIAGDSSPGSFDTYRFNYSDNTHNEIEVYNGDDGIGIASFTKISGNNAPGTFNVYRLTYTNGQHSDISVYNGADGRGITGVTKVAGDNSPGTLDTYQIQFTDNTFFEFSVRNGYSGRGIVNITRTNGNGTNGTFDTYTITYTDNTTTTFDVYNGKDGKSISLKDGNTTLVSEIASLDISGDGVVKTIDGDSVKLVINHPLDIAGNAATATKLHTTRKINGVDFDGTTDITINAEDTTPRIAVSEKGAAFGVAPLDENVKIPSIYLPSYVDDVIEAPTLTSLPVPGESGKIYVTLDTHKQYRWSGTEYAEISASPGSTDAVLEGSMNLYFTYQRVRDTILTGLDLASSAIVSAGDSILSAFGKLQKQISDNLTALTNHTGNTNNPHSTTAAQVGADPSGTAASAVAAHASDANAHTAVFYTKTQSDAKFNLATTKSGTSVAATTNSIDIIGNYVAATANTNAVTLTFSNPLSGSIFYATDYGTLTDGTDAGTVSAAQATANTNTIIAAIAAASSAVGKKPGGIVLLPAGTFHISSTITINTSSVVLMGSGRLGNTDIGSQTGKGTTLFWNNTASAATVAMVEVVSVSGPTNPAVKGSGLCNMTLQGAGNVGIGLRVKSIHWGIFRELYIINPTAKGISTECFITGTELGEAADTTKCTFENIGIRLLESSATAVGFFLDGATNANTSNCTFRNLAASVQGAQLALDCRNTDSNRFYDLTWNQSNGGTVQPTVLRGAAVAGTECRGNIFYSLASGGGSTGVRGVLVEGTNTAGVTFPAKNNVFYGYSIENGEPLPLVGTAADIVCQTAGGGLSPRATLTNSTATTETIVAKFQLPENALYAGSMHEIRVLGQVSSRATLIYRIRIGTLGTTADAVAATFTTTAAGADNAHTSADVLVTCLTAGATGTATAGGSVQLVSVAYSPATAAFAAATVNTTARLFVSVSVQQSLAQTYTARAASINRIA